MICLYRFTNNTLFDKSNKYPLCIIRKSLVEVNQASGSTRKFRKRPKTSEIVRKPQEMSGSFWKRNEALGSVMMCNEELGSVRKH